MVAWPGRGRAERAIGSVMDENGDMTEDGSRSSERYPGERQGLGLFLEELQPVVARQLGTGSLLHHAIKKALAGARLEALRHARALFNSLPRDERQALQAGIVASPEPAPRRDRLLDDYGSRQPQPFVTIDSEIGPGADPAPQIALRHELLDDIALRVLVRPGSLPSGVANRLRELADLIDQDRRLLSARHWRAARMELVTDRLEAGNGQGSAESG
jgi:hypothetical protein